MPMTLSQQAETSRLATLSARIAGALQRRLENKGPVEGDDYVLDEGRGFLRSLDKGGMGVSGEEGGYLDSQAMSALPAALDFLSALYSKLWQAKVEESHELASWRQAIQALDETLNFTHESTADRLEAAIRFFERLEARMSSDLDSESEPAPPTVI